MRNYLVLYLPEETHFLWEEIFANKMGKQFHSAK